MLQALLPQIQQKMYDEICDCNATHEAFGTWEIGFPFWLPILPTLGINYTQNHTWCTDSHACETPPLDPKKYIPVSLRQFC